MSNTFNTKNGNVNAFLLLSSSIWNAWLALVLSITYFMYQIIFVLLISIKLFYFFVDNRLENNILVVAMYPTENGKYNKIYNVFGSPNHPLHFLKVTSLLYSRDQIFDDGYSREAVRVISDFLFPKGGYKTLSEWVVKVTICHVTCLCGTFEHKIPR